LAEHVVGGVGLLQLRGPSQLTVCETEPEPGHEVDGDRDHRHEREQVELRSGGRDLAEIRPIRARSSLG